MNTVQFYGVDTTALIKKKTKKVKKSLKSELTKTIQENEPKRYLSADEVCKRFRITKPTLHEYRKRNILKSYRLGARVYYRLDEIENAMIIND